MKMHYKILFVLLAVLAIVSSCQKLDIKPVNLLTDDQIFSSESGVNVYMAQVYRKLPIEDFTYRPTGRDNQPGFNLHHEWNTSGMQALRVVKWLVPGAEWISAAVLVTGPMPTFAR